jgi:hypothetical protein
MFLFDLIDEPVGTMQQLPMRDLFFFLPFGYIFTILIETPVLLFAMSRKVAMRQRLWLGVWLTACTYPIVILFLPAIFYGSSRALYLLVAETFAPVAECALFWLAYRSRQDFAVRDWIQCFIAITVANLASFGLGEVLNYFQWLGIF